MLVLLLAKKEEERMYPQPPFNPEELNLLYRAYAAALRDIEFSEARKNDDPPGNETCLAVALRIVAAAANGERDPSRLKQLALRNLQLRQ